MSSPELSLNFYQLTKKGHRLPQATTSFVNTLAKVVDELCSMDKDKDKNVTSATIGL